MAELRTKYNVYCYLQNFTTEIIDNQAVWFPKKKPSSAHYQRIFEDNDEI